jgi:hypothetical protein
VTIAEIEKRALALSERQRARLAVSLLETLSPPEAEVSDEAVLQRNSDLESRRVEEIPHEDFVRKLKRRLGR